VKSPPGALHEQGRSELQVSAKEVAAFWLDEIGPEGWYRSDPEIDAAIRARFEPAVHAAAAGELDAWQTEARSCLALLILLDQFPRNLYREDARAFACDAKAVAVAKRAVALGQDREIAMPARQFFYMPLMHSESVADQDRAVRLLLLAAPDGGGPVHARAHRLVIRRFGRFPYRNRALGRQSSPAELAFLEAGGYSAAFAEVSET